MGIRSQKRTRRDINRLNDVVTEHAPVHGPLEAIQPEVSATTARVEETKRLCQAAAVKAVKERKERDDATATLLTWSRSWRGVVIIKVPGAREKIHELPANGATPDDVVRQARDLKALIETRPADEPFRVKSIAELGTKIEDAEREGKEAASALPAAEAAEEAYAQATIDANTLIVEASRIIRNIFGPKSREYKQFVARAKPEEEDEDDADDDEVEDDTDVTGTDTTDVTDTHEDDAVT